MKKLNIFLSRIEIDMAMKGFILKLKQSPALKC